MNPGAYVSLAVSRKRLTIALCSAVILSLGAGLVRMETVDVDVRNHFGKDDPQLAALDRLENTYSLTDNALATVSAIEGTIFTPAALQAIGDLTDQLWLTPYVSRVDSISNYDHSEGLEDELIVEPLVGNPSSLTETDIERIRQIALGTEEVAGRLVSRDGRVAALAISVVLPDDRQAGRIESTDFLNETLQEARSAHPDLEFHLTGDIALNRAMSDALQQEMSLLGPIALATMLVVAFVLIGSILGTASIVLMLAAVMVSALGFAGWAGISFYGESGAALFVLMAVTVAHAVHIIEAVLARLRRGLDRNQAAIEAVEANIWPVFLTSLTTAIGFLSLNFSEMPPFRVMGNIVAFGTMAAFFWSVTLLPAVLSILPLRGRASSDGGNRLFDRFGQLVVARPLAMLCGSAVIIAILIAGIWRINLQENWLELLDERYEFRRSTDFISENFNGLETLEYSLSSGREGGVTDIDYLGEVEAFADWFRGQPEVVHVFAVTDVIKRLNMNLNADDADFYDIPANSDLAAQYLLLFEFSLPVGRDLNNLIDVGRSESRMTVVMGSLTTKEKIELDERAQDWLRDNESRFQAGASGVAIVGAHSIQRNIENMLIGTVTAMAIVSLILMLVFRSLRLGLISLIPNFVPAAMALGLWGHLVGDVGVAASVVTAIAFGIIVDDTIHFMTKYVRARNAGDSPADSVRSAFRTVGKALVATTAVFALGLLVFGASGMTNNQSLGILVGITVIFALLADFLFLPPLLVVLDNLRLRRRSRAGDEAR